MFKMNMLKACFTIICIFSFIILPFHAQAASFSEMLKSLTQAPSSWDRESDDEKEKETSPVSEKEPSWGTNRAQVSSEQLLDADGNWNVVEKGRKYDPAQAHLNARNKVDTGRRKKMNELSPHFKPDAKSGQDGKLRVLQIEIEDSVDHSVAEGKAEGNGRSFLDKVFPVFSPNSSGVDNATVVDHKPTKNINVVIPKIKPKISNGNGGVYKAVMVGGIVVPPLIPARKKSLILYDNDPVSGVNDKVIAPIYLDDIKSKIPSDQIVIPERKPSLITSKSKIMGLNTGLTKTATDIIEVNINSNGIPVPTVKPRIKKVVLKNGKASKKGVFVKSLRSGMHPDKTRVVIEISDVTEYKVTVDDLRNVLRIKLINTKWNISEQDKLKGSVLLGTYIARQSDDGDILLEVRLKEKVKIIGTMVLRPNSSSSHRIVIDLKVL